ncbi:MAG: ABC transporter permease subunit [Ruminococcus sp.]|nr:ABC transporter permease subunit [Ruminococcus sp.]
MLDIMRFQFRQLIRKKVVYAITLLIFVVLFMTMFFSGSSEDPVTKASEFVPEMLSVFMGCAALAAGALVGMVSGDDMSDKTINHEIMAGRSRAASYLGRVIPVLIAAPIVALIVYGAPFLLYGALYGWGDTLPASAVLTRCLLAMLPMLRLCAFMAMLTFIAKNAMLTVTAAMVPSFIAIGLATGAAQSSAILSRLMERPWLISVADLAYYGSFDSWYTYDLNMYMYMTYYPSIPAGNIALTVILSLAMTAVYLVIGYHYFHFDDMN